MRASEGSFLLLVTTCPTVCVGSDAAHSLAHDAFLRLFEVNPWRVLFFALRQEAHRDTLGERDDRRV